MNIFISDSTNIINKYKECHELANYFGQVIVSSNEQQNSVLVPACEHKRLNIEFEKSDNINKINAADLVKRLPPAGNRKVYTLAQLKHDLSQLNLS